ncbi:MAG: mandelate racemase/muconate lactonizing enzyme family protein [Pseudomonadota bacterium]
MKITAVHSHVMEYDLPEELGYSQQYYAKRSCHLVEVRTDAAITGWGECFGPGPVARVNRAIVEGVIAPLIVGKSAFDREVIWHEVYNRLRDHGQKGMPIQALSGVDIALWDAAGKALGVPLTTLLGGRFRDTVPVYGYGMMLCRMDTPSLAARFATEARELEAQGFRALKMKVGHGPAADIALVEATRHALSDDTALMVDANHAYHVTDALKVGCALDRLGIGWFEEPVAPEDLCGYRELRAALSTPIAGGEAEFTRWGWRPLLEARALSIAQPEVCALGGISEFQRVLALAHSHFVPVINHVWGSPVALAVNLQLLAAMPPLPGGLYPAEPMLEYDTTHHLFRDELALEPLTIAADVAAGGRTSVPDRPGHGITPNPDVLAKYAVPR